MIRLPDAIRRIAYESGPYALIALAVLVLALLGGALGALLYDTANPIELRPFEPRQITGTPMPYVIDDQYRSIQPERTEP